MRLVCLGSGRSFSNFSSSFGCLSSSGLSSLLGSLFLGLGSISSLLGLEFLYDSLYCSCAMDSTRWTFSYAHATSLALLGIDKGQVVCNGDGTELTGLLALAATDTSVGAGLAGHATFVLVDTAYPNTLDSRSLGGILLSNLNHELRTSLGTSATSHTFFLVNFGKSGDGIHVNGIKSTSPDTVTQTETAKCATGLSSEGRGCYSTRLHAIIG